MTKPDDCEANPQCKHASGAADKAAKSAVRDVFAILGVDIDDPRQVEDFRCDLRMARTVREAANKGFMTLVAVIITGAVVALWYGAKLPVIR